MTENRIWLIRHPNNSFSRPIPENELKQMFSSGEMKPQDEICPANGYWFSLQDVKEMRKHFGNMPMDGIFKKVKEEITQERFAVTAPIAVPASISNSSRPHASSSRKTARDEPAEISIRQASPLMKALLVVATLGVVILLFVWFG